MRSFASLTVATARRFSLAAAVVLASGAVLGARADMVETFTYTVPSAETPYSTSINLDLFNRQLGTLTGVNISLMATITAEVDVININATRKPFTNAFSSVPTTVTGPGPTTVSTTATATVASGTVPGRPFVGGYGETSITNLSATSTNATNVAAANFGLYETYGNHVAINGLTASADDGIFGGQAAPGVFFSGDAIAGEKITVTYHYTPYVVPVPASIVMLGTGLIPAVGAWVRRRRSVA